MKRTSWFPLDEAAYATPLILGHDVLIEDAPPPPLLLDAHGRPLARPREPVGFDARRGVQKGAVEATVECQDLRMTARRQPVAPAARRALDAVAGETTTGAAP